MRIFRACLAVILLAVAVPASSDQILGPGRIDNSGRVVLPGGPTLGKWQSGKYIATPDVLQLPASNQGSSGAIDGFSVGGVALPSVLAGKAPVVNPSFIGTLGAAYLKFTGPNGGDSVINTTASTGSGVALRAGDGQGLCWGAGSTRCLYNASAFGLIWATSAGSMSGATTKFLVDDFGNQSLTGNLFSPGVVSRTTGARSFVVRPEWAGSPAQDVMRYANALDYHTTRDGDSWESSLGIDYISDTGYNKPWASGLTVAVGDNILGTTGNPEGYVYRVTQAGNLGTTSPTAGPGSAPFTSGTAQLQWINYDNLAAKIAFTNTMLVRGNTGKAWLNNFNYSMQAMNNMPSFMTNTEFDFYNGSGHDCALFTGISCGSVTLFTGGPNISTSVIGMSPLLSTPADKFAAEWGITMKGANLTRDSSIDIATGGKFALTTGRNAFAFGTTTYSTAVWRDESSSPYAVSLGGIYSQAAIDLQSATTPVALAIRAGQKICFFGTENCFLKDNSQGKLLYQVGGVTVMSIGDDGTIRSKGAIIQNTTP